MTRLLLSDVFPPRHGGSGRWLWELYSRLDPGSAMVVAGHADGDTAFDAATSLPVARAPLTFSNWGLLHHRSLLEYAGMYRRVWALGRRHRPTAIHCAKALPEGLIGLAAGRTLGIPYVCFAHGEELTLARTTRELRWLTRRVLHGASQLVANSHNTKRLLVNDWGVVEARVIVMHPGVDAARFVPATPDPRVRSTLGWTDRRVVLTVGALQKRKGQDTVIRSLPAIARRCPDVLYVVAGEGWERPYLEGLVDELQVHDYVQFRGTPRDDELIQCYQQCDLFVLANRQVGWDFEGFGIVLLEAQACGKPVVAGVSGGAPETLEAGVSGEVVDGDSVDSVAEVVASLLDDPDRRARMGAAARRRIERHFTWDILARQAAELLE